MTFFILYINGMIIEKEVKIKIGSRIINHIKKCGYDVKIGDVINLPVDKLPKGSHVNVKCRCDNCGREKTMWYKEYIGCTKDNSEKYVCKKCNYIKISSSNLSKYGVKNIMMLKETINKMKKNKYYYLWE